MALDSLGLGLTLDTTLLAKADKTLENMHRNSQLIMQNLNRGFSAFNRGDISDFSKPFDAIKKAMDTIKNSKVSVEFDSAGQDRFLEGLNQIMEQVERIRQIGEVGDNKIKFFDPSTVKVTTESLTELKAKAEEIEEAFKDVQKELSHAIEFGKDVSGNEAKITKLKDDLSEIGKAAGLVTKDFSQMKNELMDALSTRYSDYNEADKALKEREKQINAEAKAENSKISKQELENLRAQDEQIQQLKASVEEKKKVWEEASNILKKYTQQLEELRTLEAKKEAHDNLQLNRDKEKAYQELLAENRAQQKFASATTAQQNAMIVSEEHKRLSDENKRIATLTKNYLEAVSNYEKYQSELSQLLDNITTVGKKRTSAQDEEGTRLLQEIDRARSIIQELKKEAPEVIEKIEAVKRGENTQKIAAESAEKVKASLDYAKVFSDNAKSIDEEIEAISMLKRARNALSSNNNANYDKEIAEANKRISKHEDHVKLLTQEQKESKTLEDSVISRYLRERKEADKLGDELRELNRVRKERGTDYSPEEKQNINALINRWRTLRQDISEIESNNAAHLSQLQEKYASQRAEDEIKIMLATNEREKQEYAKLLDDLYAIEKQKKAMEDAGAKSGDKAYDNILQQEQDLNNRISQLKAKHQNDLDEIDKKHAKKRNDDEVKAFIDAQKEKQRIAEEYAKKQREKAKKYGTISSSSVDRLIGVTENAKNINQHKAAIEKLTQARNSLNITDKDYLKTVKKLNDAIKWHHIEVEIAEDKSKGLMQTHRGLMDIGGQLMRRLALVFSVSQLTQYFRKLVEVRGEFEKQEVALQTLLKSKYQSNILMQQVTDLAVKSPFTLQQLIGYTKQLAAYQIEYKKLYSTTKMLADVSAGLGVEMDRLILAFGQVRAANYLRATEVRQFTEAGMDILGELAKYYSELEDKMVSVADVQERVTKRMVGFSDVEEVFKRVTSAGGIFYDMQAKQAETLSGQWSNLQDKIGIMFNEIGKGTDGLLKGIVRFLASIVDNWEKASTVLTALVGSFVAVKINTALASKELIKFVRTMGLIKGRVKSVSILQTLGAVFVKLGKSIKSAALAMKGFAVSHPIITALTLLATLIGAVYKEWTRQEEAAKNVRKQYDELSESVEKLAVAFNRMGREGNFEGQKKQLEELVTLANNEYQMNIKVNLEGATAEEVTQQFIDLQQKMLLLNSFATDFNTDYAQSGKSTEKSMKKYGEVAKETLKSLVQDAERVAFTLDKLESEGVKLTDSQVEARNKLAEPRQIDESELDYLQRLMGAFSLLTYEYENMEDERAKALQGLDFDSEEYTKTAMDFTRSLIDIQDRMSEMGLSIGDITKIYSKYNKAQGEAIKKYNEFLDKVEVPSFLTEEGKEERIKFAIDTYAAQNQWDEFMINLAYDLANKKFVINITPEVDLPSDDKLKAWQKTYNEKFAKYEGFTKIGKSDTTQAHQIDILNDAFKKQEELVKQIEKVGTQGAYQGYKLADEQKKLAQIVAQLNWFGIDPKTKGKDEVLENLKNQIGLVKEMNKEYEKLNKTYSKTESLEKVKKAYEDTAKELKLDISKMDFTDKGTIETLEKLLGDPKYSANTYALELKKALDGFKAEVDLEADEQKTRELVDQVQEIFDDYELAVDIKKLNLPPELAKNLFGVDTKSFDQMRTEIISKFAGTNAEVSKILSKGSIISAEDEKILIKAIGEDRVDKAKEALEKIQDLEDKAQLERLKKYVEYAKKGVSERAKIKLEEMRQLEEIQKTFEAKDGDSEEVKAQKKDMANRASEKVRKESQEALNRLDWGEFEKSDMFIRVFDDLDSASTSLLSHLIDKIQGFKDEWTDMPLEDVEKIIEALNKLQTKLAEANPWKEFKNAKKDFDEAKKAVKFEDKEAKELSEKRGAGNYMAALDKEDIAQQKVLNDANKQIAALEVQLATQEKIVATTEEEKAAKAEAIAKTTKELDTQKGIKAAAEGNLKATQKVRKEHSRIKTSLAAQYSATSKCLDMAVELGSAFKDLVGVLTKDDPAMVFAEMGLNMLTTVANTFALQAQLMAAQVAATGLGAAMNTAAGVIGWIVMAIQLLVQAISAAVNYAEKMRQMKLDVLAGQVDNLKQKFDALAESIDEAWSLKQLKEYEKELDKVQDKMKDAQKDYIKLLESGKDGDTIDLAKQAQEKLDQGFTVDDLSKKQRKALLSEEYQDYKDAVDALAEIEEDYADKKQEILESVGGITDPHDAASEFVDAWLDAYKETGDGLAGLEENFDEFFENLVKQKAARMLSDTLLTKWIDSVNGALAEDSEGGRDLTESEMSDIKAAQEKAKGDINNLLKGLFEGLDISTQGSGGLSELQKGIQGITEDTAQIIEAYLNSVRGYVSEQVTHTKNIYNLLRNVSSRDGTTALQVRMIS